ncbi:RecX family transcriptional regulator [Atopobacter sp. AH10]|uniref:RecX family transcriptional regulator n=1 Tax=Atopobacter sp. AH10 TaxID=2315861 RepID=UPI001314A1C5|nr:RecX family transcriptional regulator [Atopobacter sp. AH10]
MPKITSIALQKGDRHRYNIYLDGEFFLGLSENVLVHLGLYKGMEISKQEIEEVKELEQDAQLKTLAMRYLERRLRTEQEVRDHLKEESEDLDRIERIVAQIKEMGYINDLVYAESYVRTQMRVQKLGPKAISRELIKKGVPLEDVQKAEGEYKKEIQLANAVYLAGKTARSKKSLSDRQIHQKMQEHLIKKGYSSDVIQEAIDQVDLTDLLENQKDRLIQAGEKAYRTYQSKASGKELRRKVYQSLLRKGFSSEDIANWLSELPLEGDAE